ncbi:hypothetical protein CBS101457_006172 [Exobasidium rhododendri]|nr:hypothetical protein CBS101457_006172 [Exobasidium rhododendri]
MSPPLAGLRTGSSKPATPVDRLQGMFNALVLVTILYIYGLPHALWVQLTHPNPLHLLNPVRWRNLIIEAGLPKLLIQGDVDSGHLKRLAITEYASGKVFELGAGSGLSLKYYDTRKVTEVILVEPFEKLHAELRENIQETGTEFAAKTKIVPYGIERRERLKDYGVQAGTFDTVVLVQVLCSIPDIDIHLPYLQSLLKPGGQLLLFEHVASEDRLTELLQNIYNPVWTRLSMGCNVNRHSGNLVKNLGGWKEVQLRIPDAQHNGLFYPRVIGRYVKA